VKFAPKRSAQNGPATKWATPKRAKAKRAMPKRSRHKVVYPTGAARNFDWEGPNWKIFVTLFW